MKKASGCIFERNSSSFLVGLMTIWNTLHRLGMKLTKTKNLPKSRSGKAEKIYGISKKHNKNKLIFVDELDIDRHPHRKYCRGLKGKQMYKAVSILRFE